MPALTRRRSPDHRHDCWHVYYGDVHVGTIALRTGVPHDEDPWGWSCGFYPGSHPGGCTNGSAAALGKRSHGRRGQGPTIPTTSFASVTADQASVASRSSSS